MDIYQITAAIEDAEGAASLDSDHLYGDERRIFFSLDEAEAAAAHMTATAPGGGISYYVEDVSDRVEIDPGRCGGRPTFRGSGLAVTEVAAKIASGDEEEIYSNYDRLDYVDFRIAAAWSDVVVTAANPRPSECAPNAWDFDVTAFGVSGGVTLKVGCDGEPATWGDVEMWCGPGLLDALETRAPSEDPERYDWWHDVSRRIEAACAAVNASGSWVAPSPADD